MRTFVSGWIVATLLALVCTGTLIAASPPDIREPEQIVFEGVEKAAIEDIKIALRTDFDTLLAGHPDARLFDFLRTIEAKTVSGYSYAGFSAAKATAEYDDQRQRIVVYVEEGPRHFCGDVHISGAKQADITALSKAITQPASRRSTAWAKGSPAPFDEPTKQRIHKELKDAFAEQGFLSPSFAVQIVTVPESNTATLEIAINDEGPRAEIGEITIRGNHRDSEADILHYLDIRPGQRYDSGLTDRLKTRLTESGRYLSVKIHAANTKNDGDRELVPLNIELREYDQAPPLFENFTAEENALLAFRDWVHHWSRGETAHDMVIELSGSGSAVKDLCDEMDMPMPPVENVDIHSANLRIVVGPNRGKAVTLCAKDASGKAVWGQFALFYPDRLVLGAPLRGTKLTMPQQQAIRITLTTETGPNKPTDKGGEPFHWMFGVSVKSNKHTASPSQRVSVTLDAAATLSFLHHDDVSCELDRGVWKLQRGGDTPTICQLDAEAGRPILLEGQTLDEDTGDTTGRLTIRTEIQAWEREAALIETQLASAVPHDATSPLKALLEYGLDEALFVMRLSGQAPENVAAAQSLRKLISRWSPPALAELWTPELTEIHGNLDEPDEDNQRFSLPWKPFHWKTVDFQKKNSPSLQFLAAAGLPTYRRLVPHDGWLWPVGRDLILGQASDSATPVNSLLKTAKTYVMGPIGALVAASANPNSAISSVAAHEGRQLLSVEGFRKDYQPLLSGDGWLSQWILSLAEAARSLDESELRSLTNPISDDPLVQNCLASFILALKEEPEKPVATGLSRMLNVAWNLGLRDQIASQLKKLGSANQLASPIVQPSTDWKDLTPEQRLRASGFPNTTRTYGNFHQPTLPGINNPSGSDQLNALEKLAEELQKPATKTDDKPAEKEPISISEYIDRQQKTQKK